MVDVSAILETSPGFRQLPEPVRRALAAMATIERYEHRTLLNASQEQAKSIRYVVEGRVDLMQASKDGRFAAIPIAAGNWATWLACFLDSPTQHEMWSSKGAVYVVLPCRRVKQELSKSPEALLEVVERIGETTRTLISWVFSASLRSPERRAAYLLLVLAGAMQSDPRSESRARATHEVLSQAGLGSRQRVAKLLRSLEVKGLVRLGYSAIEVPSWSDLREFALSG